MDEDGQGQLHSSQDTSKAPPYAQGHSSPADTSHWRQENGESLPLGSAFPGLPYRVYRI
jgi:hypothetical protein